MFMKNTQCEQLGCSFTPWVRKRVLKEAQPKLALLGTWIYIWSCRQRSPNETEQEPRTPVWKELPRRPPSPPSSFGFKLWLRLSIYVLQREARKCNLCYASQLNRHRMRGYHFEEALFYKAFYRLKKFLNSFFPTFIWCDEGDWILVHEGFRTTRVKCLESRPLNWACLQ